MRFSLPTFAPGPVGIVIALLAALVLGLLGGWQLVGQGGGTIWAMGMLSTAALLVPVLLWASHWAALLWGNRAFAGLPIPQNARPLHPVEVTMLDADGNPVERPGQGALDR